MVSCEGIIIYPNLMALILPAVCERYYKSLYEDHRREQKGTKARHRAAQKHMRRKKEVNKVYYVQKLQSLPFPNLSHFPPQGHPIPPQGHTP